MPFRDDDGDDTVPCPHCKRAVYEGVARCPYCGTYISEEDAPPARNPWWIIVGSLAVMAVVALWIFWNS